MLVSGSYFPVLELTPALGRLLGPEDDRARRRIARVVVLSHAYWATRFAADPNALNQQLIVNGQTLTIVGVAPRGFDGTTLGTQAAGVRADHAARARWSPGFKGFDNRQIYWAYLFARLKPGVVDRDGARRAERASTTRSSTTSRRRCRRA